MDQIPTLLFEPEQKRCLVQRYLVGFDGLWCWKFSEGVKVELGENVWKVCITKMGKDNWIVNLIGFTWTYVTLYSRLHRASIFESV